MTHRFGLVVGVPVVASLLGATLQAQSRTENLQSAWDTALRADHQVRSARRITESAEREIAAAKAIRLPSVAVQSTYTVLDNTPAAIFSLPLGLPGLPASLTVRPSVDTQNRPYVDT